VLYTGVVGDFTLSVLDQGAPRHYKITASSRGLLLTGCEDEAFGDLQILVDYYVKASKVRRGGRHSSVCVGCARHFYWSHTHLLLVQGRSNPLDKGAVEKLESAFDAPVVRIEGLILPGMRIQMEEEERANRQ
jgi:hypothetical protein